MELHGRRLRAAPLAALRLCSVHAEQWQEAETRGIRRAQFLRTAEPLPATEMPEAMTCRICQQRPAFSLQLVLCFRHRNRWLSHLSGTPKDAEGDFERWLADQPSLPGYGECRRTSATNWQPHRWGCAAPTSAATSGPGGPAGRSRRRTSSPPTSAGTPVPVTLRARSRLPYLVPRQLPVHRTGTVNLRGLRPLLRAEFQWGMYASHGPQPVAVWHLTWVQRAGRMPAAATWRPWPAWTRLSFTAYHQRMVQEMHQPCA